MAELGLLQRRVEELGALLAIFGEQLTVESLEPPELLFAVQDANFDARSLAHLAGCTIRLTLAVLALPPNSSGGGGSGGGVERWQACLHLSLPPAYPQQPLLVTAVTCERLGRDAEGSCRQRLQALADAAGAGGTGAAEGSSTAAPAGGQECLYQLLEALLQDVQKQQQKVLAPALPAAAAAVAAKGGGGATAAAAAAAIPTSSSSGGGGSSPQVALLRLDHMHARAAYTRTIRRWAGELGLGGRLLFCGPLILILLEGRGADIKEYLVRQRTQKVDVDSKGRPCKERMMSLICIASAPSSSTQQHSNSGGGSGSNSLSCSMPPRLDAAAGHCSSPTGTQNDSWSGGGGDTGSKLTCTPGTACVAGAHGGAIGLFRDFRAEEVDVRQLAALLRAAGLEQHWPDATGLPMPPPLLPPPRQPQLAA